MKRILYAMLALAMGLSFSGVNAQEYILKSGKLELAEAEYLGYVGQLVTSGEVAATVNYDVGDEAFMLYTYVWTEANELKFVNKYSISYGDGQEQPFEPIIKLSGNMLAIASPLDSGSVIEVFELASNGQATRVSTVSPPEDIIFFGQEFDFYNDKLVAIGNTQDSFNQPESFFLFFYQKLPNNTWTLISTVADSNFEALAGETQFRLAIDNDNVFLSNLEDNGGKGAIYRFPLSGTEVGIPQELPNTLIGSELYLGAALATAGDFLITSAPGADDLKGRVLIYKKSSSGAYVYHQTLQPTGLQEDDQFGVVISADSSVVAITAIGVDEYTGKVYLYRLNADDNWELATTFTEADLAIDSEYGASVSIKGNRLVIGAPYIGEDKGAIYFYTFDRAAGVEEAKALELGSYPNPAQSNGLIKISVNSGAPQLVSIYSMQGQLVSQQAVVEGGITAPAQAGMYLLRATVNYAVVTARVVVQ